MYKEIEDIIDVKMQSLSGCLEVDDEYHLDFKGDVADIAVNDTLHYEVIKKKERDGILYKALRDAKKRININAYGLCNICEEEIEMERLRALPTVNTCIHCQEIIEREK